MDKVAGEDFSKDRATAIARNRPDGGRNGVDLPGGHGEAAATAVAGWRLHAIYAETP